MQVDKILEFLQNGGWGIIVFLGAFIEIPKIKLNLWQLLFKLINKPILDSIEEMTAESRKCDETLLAKIEEVDTKLQSHIDTDGKDKTILCRKTILDACDDMNSGKEFSQESWIELMRKIDVYENYCNHHPEFRNSLCVESIKELREAYHKRECRCKK